MVLFTAPVTYAQRETQQPPAAEKYPDLDPGEWEMILAAVATGKNHLAGRPDLVRGLEKLRNGKNAPVFVRDLFPRTMEKGAVDRINGILQRRNLSFKILKMTAPNETRERDRRVVVVRLEQP